MSGKVRVYRVEGHTAQKRVQVFQANAAFTTVLAKARVYWTGLSVRSVVDIPDFDASAGELVSLTAKTNDGSVPTKYVWSADDGRLFRPITVRGGETWQGDGGDGGDDGQPWGSAWLTAAGYGAPGAVDGVVDLYQGYGRMTTPTGNWQYTRAYLPGGDDATDGDMTFTFQVPTNRTVKRWLYAYFAGKDWPTDLSSNPGHPASGYEFGIQFGNGTTVGTGVWGQKYVSGATSGGWWAPYDWSKATEWRARCSVRVENDGSRWVRFRAWPKGAPEPKVWGFEALDVEASAPAGDPGFIWSNSDESTVKEPILLNDFAYHGHEGLKDAVWNDTRCFRAPSALAGAYVTVSYSPLSPGLLSTVAFGGTTGVIAATDGVSITESITLTRDAGTQAGDLLVAIIYEAHNPASGGNQILDSSGQWTLIGGSFGEPGTGSVRIFTRRPSTSGTSSYTFTSTFDAQVAEQHHLQGIILRYTGADPDNPLSALAINDYTTAGSAPVVSPITPSFTGGIEVAFWGGFTGSEATAVGYTTRGTRSVASTEGFSVMDRVRTDAGGVAAPGPGGQRLDLTASDTGVGLNFVVAPAPGLNAVGPAASTRIHVLAQDEWAVVPSGAFAGLGPQTIIRALGNYDNNPDRDQDDLLDPVDGGDDPDDDSSADV